MIVEYDIHIVTALSCVSKIRYHSLEPAVTDHAVLCVLITLCMHSEQDLDRANKAILLPDGSVVPYDTLILCAGRYCTLLFIQCWSVLFITCVVDALQFHRSRKTLGKTATAVAATTASTAATNATAATAIAAITTKT
jgi:hypothetical protein